MNEINLQVSHDHHINFNHRIRSSDLTACMYLLLIIPIGLITMSSPAFAQSAKKEVSKASPKTISKAASKSSPKEVLKAPPKKVSKTSPKEAKSWFGSYGRVGFSSNLEGGEGQRRQITMYAPRLIEDNYLELDWGYWAHRSRLAKVKTVFTIAFFLNKD